MREENWDYIVNGTKRDRLDESKLDGLVEKFVLFPLQHEKSEKTC